MKYRPIKYKGYTKGKRDYHYPKFIGEMKKEWIKLQKNGLLK